ncbi:hypothetical protein C3747_99g158 [Trypanosoma cruzi]|uniref:Uncharacterized protein n=2 Tax=Trypanosoma cruzi TaxID=5693 RepID=Q4DG92_TRYCC|nr:hypothetical protein, conserved [Trypanosoma cruzi]EAN91555.1 hypothetical protein, conserved [Trypanosoma cruzi]PWV07646.1 hypothetical protein C3747_99g158 [Trypanosoma cruzi]RNC55406.1 hypothetical protein TcCL_ESM07104 [Trypanosoma cruzi]|eukprot:XP_813406.1 hypothetical protein [Trypanosoma cruzi strain CL Brener]
MTAVHCVGGSRGYGGDEQPLHLSVVEAIRIQRELKRHGGEPIATEQGGRMFASQYASPLQMLRRSTAVRNSVSSCLQAEKEKGQRRRAGKRSTFSWLSASYCRAEPCIGRRKGRGLTQLLLAREARPPPFPSVAARLENDIALGLAASMWQSGNVVGHCNDRLAHLLVLSSTVVQWVGHEVQNGGEPRVPLELREAFMAVIEHFVRLECVVAREMLLTSVEEELQRQQGEYAQRQHLPERSLSGTDVRKMSPAAFSVAVESAARVIRGLVEPATLAAAAVAPTWQYSLVRTAADVPNRYDILDAMAYVLQPCRHLTVRRTFCAVTRQLALEVLWGAGNEKFGTRGGAAALRILQHINTRPFFLTVEERVAGQRFLALLERKLRSLTALLPPNALDEASRPTRELIDAVRLFCTPLA